jgi:hypothetical protein
MRGSRGWVARKRDERRVAVVRERRVRRVRVVVCIMFDVIMFVWW